MLRRQKWIMIIMCSLAILTAFSVSTGSAHAASRSSYAQLNPSAPLTSLSVPASCKTLARLGYTNEKSINYHGHVFILNTMLYGWYETLNDGEEVFCDHIICETKLSAPGSTFPSGSLGVKCGGLPWKIKQISSGTFEEMEAITTAHSGFTQVCGSYKPAGGTTYYAGWGCQSGQVRFNIPGIL